MKQALVRLRLRCGHSGRAIQSRVRLKRPVDTLELRTAAVVLLLAFAIATAAGACGGSNGGEGTTEGNRGGQGTSVVGIPTRGGQPETQTRPSGDTSGLNRDRTTTAKPDDSDDDGY